MDIEKSLARRAALYAALGEPARLAIVDALVPGDAAPGELAGRLGLGSNLLAHHLKVLEAAGVVRRTRSEGDRRRTYVTLEPDAMMLVGGGRWLAAEPRVVSRVVFVCTRNSARSQLATALWSRCGGIPAVSAGTRPAAQVHPGAVAVARRHGVELKATRPRHVDQVAREGDLVVAVCDSAHEELREVSRLHWSVPDPIRVGTDAAFDGVLRQLDERITRLAGLIDSGLIQAGAEARPDEIDSGRIGRVSSTPIRAGGTDG
ncbi:helix-turn-helix domain-containing protein [Phytoactinopolyspora limicola]|uniref:arsenate reductase/protein-tyrosine-phosphatase family protein n=1 Tax=Phytoactinopolyspora limicola TaxID=2715536 RepID=UPI001409DF26|nr:helix-turn-helix domain-containing protein [Phytoactinopolyspora limicola]